VAPRGGENGEERGGGGGVRHRMNRHDIDTAAPGCSDSGGRRTPRRRGRLTGGAG
jgi:hypothetical protein